MARETHHRRRPGGVRRHFPGIRSHPRLHRPGHGVTAAGGHRGAPGRPPGRPRDRPPPGSAVLGLRVGPGGR
ncbi:MAG: hypothetical protein F4071_13575 [Acidimicrobiaceae bacterium]|nr:hypothetical protein [Acidimicrobiaceae bacterium]